MSSEPESASNHEIEPDASAPEPAEPASSADAQQGEPSAAAEVGPTSGEFADGASDPVSVPTGTALRGALEAILLVVDEPVSRTTLAQVLGVPEPEVVRTLAEVQADYDEAARGFELREVGGGWRLYTRADFAPYVERFVLDGQQARLTQAALETLAVVAYRQPVSRSRVSAVRGVNVDGVMRTLVTRGLVEESGADPETGAVLYRTTPYFLERLGIRDLTELPRLADYLPEGTSIDDIEGQLSTEGRDV